MADSTDSPSPDELHALPWTRPVAGIVVAGLAWIAWASFDQQAASPGATAAGPGEILGGVVRLAVQVSLPLAALAAGRARGLPSGPLAALGSDSLCLGALVLAFVIAPATTPGVADLARPGMPIVLATGILAGSLAAAAVGVVAYVVAVVHRVVTWSPGDVPAAALEAVGDPSTIGLLWAAWVGALAGPWLVRRPGTAALMVVGAGTQGFAVALSFWQRGELSLATAPTVVGDLLVAGAAAVFAGRMVGSTGGPSREEDAPPGAIRSSILSPEVVLGTLGSIRTLVSRQPAIAGGLLLDLTRLAQHAVRQAPLTTIEREVEVVHSYLTLEKARLGERLDYEVEVEDPELRVLSIPTGILLALVECAVIRGIEPARDPGRVKLAIQRTGSKHVLVVVEDDGVGYDPGPDGPHDVAARLARSYGSGVTPQVIATPGHGTKVVLEMPARRERTGEVASAVLGG